MGAWNFIHGDPRMFVVSQPETDQDSVLVKIHIRSKPQVEFLYPKDKLQAADGSVTLDQEICAKIAATE